MSQRGPLAEIHDASPQTGEGASLFGFVGLDAMTRAQLGETELIRRITEQLAEIYGEQARTYQDAFLKDWSTEPFTAGPRDQEQLRHHPRYGLNPDLGAVWTGRLKFISSESASTNGGLTEGALEASSLYVKETIGSDIFLIKTERAPHTASMAWDWL